MRHSSGCLKRYTLCLGSRYSPNKTQINNRPWPCIINVGQQEGKLYLGIFLFQHHPDTKAKVDTPITHHDSKDFLPILEAYKVLSKPDSRAAYDFELAHGRSFRTVSGSPGQYAEHRYNQIYILQIHRKPKFKCKRYYAMHIQKIENTK